MFVLPSDFRQYDSTQLPPGFTKIRSGKHGHHWAEFDQPIVKSHLDKKDYRLIRLDNGLEAVVVSDLKADQGAASVVFRVGSFHDPSNLPGLAHLCEHLLFNGSKKYPGESEYENYISNNNGYTNASTGCEYSNFFFSVSVDHLGGALDRMASVFLHPLFERSLVEREINAVNSEFEGNKQKDGWRVNAMLADTSRKGHPSQRFAIGSRETLLTRPREQGIDIRDTLAQFYAEKYSANLMRLCVVGNQSLNTLIEMVSGMFSDMPSSNIQPSIFPDNPIGPDQMLNKLTYKTVRDVDHLVITFPLKDQRNEWATQPVPLIGMLIEHEGKGSLLSYLKAKGWADSTCAGEGDAATGYSAFDISIGLTKSGKDNYRDVIISVFSFIKLLKMRGARALERSSREYANITKNNFEWSEPGDAVGLAESIASDLHEEAPKTALLSLAYEQVWNESAVQDILDQLDPCKWYMVRGTQDEENHLSFPLKASYFGTEYRIDPIDADLLEICKNPPQIAELELPNANPFIPFKLSVAQKEEPQTSPIVVSDVPKIWCCKDTTFLVPKTYISYELRTASGINTARDFLLNLLFTQIVDENLSQLSFQAMEAGMYYSFDPDDQGFALSFSGFSEDLPALMQAVVQGIRAAHIADLDFARIKERLARGLKNWYMNGSSALAGYGLRSILDEKHQDHQAKEAALQNIDATQVLEYGREQLKELYIEGYVHGDLSQMQALALNIQQSLQCANGRDTQKSLRFLLEEGSDSLLQQTVHNSVEVNSSCLIYYGLGLSADRQLHVVTEIFCDIFSQEFFDDLRTRQQLGYRVSLGRSSSGETVGLELQIQSEVAPNLLDEAIEVFLIKAEAFLSDMSEKTFEAHKQSVVDGLLETFKCMEDAQDYNWAQIANNHLSFDQYKRDAKRLESVKKGDIIQFYKTYIRVDGVKRAKLSIHCYSQRVQPQIGHAAFKTFLDGLEEAKREELIGTLDAKPVLKDLIEFAEKHSEITSNSEWQMSLDELFKPPAIKQEVHLIEDIKAFRSEKRLPPAPEPWI